MIPFLLHARLLGGGGGGGVINPPGWAGDTYDSADFQLGVPASAVATFTVTKDGTWSSTANTGSESGNWHSAPAADIGAGYEIRYTVTSTFGTGTVVNEASAWIALSANRTFSLTVSRSTNGTTLATRTVLVEIRASGGGAVLASGSFTMSCTAEVGS